MKYFTGGFRHYAVAAEGVRLELGLIGAAICLLPTAYWLLSTAYCLLLTAYFILLTVYWIK